MGLPKQTPTSMLYDPELGIKLKSFKSMHKQQLIDNFINDIASSDLIGDITHAISRYYQHAIGTHLPLHKAPIPIGPKSDNFKIHYLYTINLLYEQKQRCRELQSKPTNPLYQLTINDYNKHWKDIKRCQMTDITAIQQPDGTNRTRTNPTSRPFSFFTQSSVTTIPFSLLGDPGEVPAFYQALINSNSITYTTPTNFKPHTIKN